MGIKPLTCTHYVYGTCFHVYSRPQNKFPVSSFITISKTIITISKTITTISKTINKLPVSSFITISKTITIVRFKK